MDINTTRKLLSIVKAVITPYCHKTVEFPSPFLTFPDCHRALKMQHIIHQPQYRAILPCFDISPIVGTDIPGPVHKRTVDGLQRSWPVGILIIMS